MKKRLLPLLSGFLVYIFLLSNFIYFISTTKNTDFVPSSFFTKSYETYYSDETTSNVGTFITDNNENIEESIINFMQDLFTIRNDAFLTGNVEKLYKFYNTNQTFSSYSLKHEFKRIAYLRDWANERNVTFKSIQSTPTIKDLKVNNGTYNLTLGEEYKFNYSYNIDPEKLNTFGIELIHTLELKVNGDTFIITKDYYEDYFKNGLNDYDFDLTEKNIPLSKGNIRTFNFNINSNPIGSENYNRLSAVNYANKYSGISFASNEETNLNYYTYFAGAGNSTNFISQCLSDKLEGGGMIQDKDWSYKNTKTKGIIATSSWVKPEELINYLLNNNKATISYLGSVNDMSEAMHNTDKKISIGDLIVFKKGNYIESISMVTDFDNANYPLVNSNSINTYKAPFDIGFNNEIYTCLILSIK